MLCEISRGRGGERKERERKMTRENRWVNCEGVKRSVSYERERVRRVLLDRNAARTTRSGVALPHTQNLRHNMIPVAIYIKL